MVGKVIRDYMEGGAKKLTVPGFGTFMRREGGEVIFVDLLRGDDKLLSEMVEDAGGFSEVEAMALIDRFIFATKNAIERHGSATIEGFGTMTLDHKGLYQFRYSPKARPVKEHAVQEQLFEKPSPQPSLRAQPAQPAQSPGPRPSLHHSAPGPAAKSGEHPRTASPKSRPGNRPPAKRPGRKPVRGQRGKLSRTDTILVVAITAAAIALVAMIFGLSTGGNMPFLSK